MKLYICEKPSQAKDIAQVLGATTRMDNCYEGAGVQVTWCIGHLLELAPPEHYCPDLKPWRMIVLGGFKKPLQRVWSEVDQQLIPLFFLFKIGLYDPTLRPLH